MKQVEKCSIFLFNDTQTSMKAVSCSHPQLTAAPALYCRGENNLNTAKALIIYLDMKHLKVNSDTLGGI